MATDRDAPAVQPRLDSWRRQQHAATWMWSPRDRPESDQAGPLNTWTVGRVRALLGALGPQARLAEVLADGPPAAGRSLPSLTPDKGETADAFEGRVLGTIAAADFALTSLVLVFDLCAWVHVDPTGDLIQGWIARAASIDLTSEVDDPYGALQLDHTLFRDGNTHGESNHQLYVHNAPWLRQVLAEIQRVEGPFTELDGLPDVTEQGFSPRPD